MASDQWLGITESGKDFLFKTPEIKIAVKAEAPEIVETDEAPAPVKALPPRENADEDAIFQMVQIQEVPEFPGGKDSLGQYLARNLQYPRLAAENGIQGMVAIKFVIEKDGHVGAINLVRDIGGGCGQEAKRLVENMPKWTPGRKNGKKVRVEYLLPVKFRLE